MKSIILIWVMSGILSVAQAQDFYSDNEALFLANHLDKVKKNALIEHSAHRESIEANYFLALVTIKQTSDSDPSKIYAKNSYAEKFQALYRDDAKARHLMHGDQIMVSDPRFVRLFYYLGLKYLSQQDFAKSVEWLNLADVGYSDNLEFNFNIGTSYYAVKDYDKAKKYFMAALTISPNHGDSLYNLACIEAISNKPDESMMWLGKAISVDAKYKAMASKDSDLDNIRKTEPYRQLTSK